MDNSQDKANGIGFTFFNGKLSGEDSRKYYQLTNFGTEDENFREQNLE